MTEIMWTLTKDQIKRSRYLEEFINNVEPNNGLFIIIIPVYNYVLKRQDVLSRVEQYLKLPESQNIKIPIPIYPMPNNTIDKFEFVCLHNRVKLTNWITLFKSLDTVGIHKLIELANYLDLSILLHNAACYLKLLTH